MGHRRITTVVAALCAAAAVALPAGASAARHRAPAGHHAAARANARYPDEPLAVGTGGAVASMDVGASGAGIDVPRGR